MPRRTTGRSDVELLFGVSGGGKISGESGALIKSQLDAIMASLNKNPPKIKIGADLKSFSVTEIRKNLNDALKQAAAKGKLSVTIQDVKVSNAALANFRKQLNQVVSAISLDKGYSITLTADGVGEVRKQLADTEAAARQVGETAESESKQAASAAAQFKEQLKEIQAQAAAVQKNLEFFKKNASLLTKNETGGSDDLRKRYDSLIKDLTDIESAGPTAADRERVLLLQQEMAALRGVTDEKRKAAEQTIASNKAADQENRSRRSAISLLNQIEKAERDWTTAKSGSTSSEYRNLSRYSAELNRLLTELNSRQITLDQFNRSVQAVRTSFTQTSGVIRAAGENTKTLTDRFGGLAEKFTTWLTVSQIVMYLYNGLRRMLDAVIDIDTAMTELRKVTDETEERYTRFLERASDRARDLGASISDVVTATADFARLGYNIDDASELADAAIVYKNVGDGIEDISEASESIISTMKAFGVEAENAMLIVDKFNEVGRHECPAA